MMKPMNSTDDPVYNTDASVVVRMCPSPTSLKKKSGAKLKT